MKYFSRILSIVGLAFCLASCTDILVEETPVVGEVPVRVTFSMANRGVPTKSKVSGTEVLPVHSMQMVCFDANGQYVGIRDAVVRSTGASGYFVDKGTISGTVPQGTARIHFIANRGLKMPLIEHSVGDAESKVMKSRELSTAYNDADHQEVCYWGYHKEATADAMNAWLNPPENSNHIVYMIRDRAKVELSYDPTGANTPVTKIEWLIHNGRERGYLAPAEYNWINGYYANSTEEGHTDELISTAVMNEYSTSNRYSLWRSETDNDDNKFDVAFQSTGTYTPKPQFLFEDSNEEIDNLKVILKVTYTVDNTSVVRYHVLRLNQKAENPDDPDILYDIVRNNTYYVKCKLLSPDIAFYETLQEAIEGEEFVNAETEVDRTIPDINDKDYTLQIKLPNEGTSIVLNTEGEHTMDFVFRYVSDVNQTASYNPDDFEVYWEKEQTFCDEDLDVTYNSTTKQFTITATVLEGQLTDHLQDEWIVVKHKASNLKRYIHVYVIDEFRYKVNPTLTKVSGSNDYLLSFELPPMEHTQFLEDGTPDPDELIYPASLYPIDVKFTTNTLNAYGTTQGTTNYGFFGVSVEGTSQLTDVNNFETGYNSPVSSTATSNMTHWYFQQANNYWDFWYTYQLKTYPTDGIVNIYFKDVRDHINYANVTDVGLFLYVEYFGKNYAVTTAPVRVTSVSLNQTSASVARGKSLQLTATVSPSEATNSTVSWSSSNPSVATVSSDGLVTVSSSAAIGSTATITVTTADGGFTDNCVITVVRNKVTATASFTGSNFTAGNNKSATDGPITANLSLISSIYNNSWIEVNSGNSTTLTITPTSSSSMQDVTIDGITLTFYRGNRNYNPSNISGSFTGGTGDNNTTTNLNATYNGGESTQAVSTTLTARNNREFDMQITVSYYYYE